MKRLITVKGAVQGIGYRPFIAGIATEYHISGYVKNSGSQVEIFATGRDEAVLEFTEILRNKCPDGGFILSVNTDDAVNDEEGKFSDKNTSYNDYNQSFSIIESDDIDLSSEIPVFLPDIGICDDCLRELKDDKDRRFGHPLISCALCGPRLSILKKLPYDRKNTTMRAFDMCPLCEREYGSGRRKYAQTISCKDCGPQMILLTRDKEGNTLRYDREEAVAVAISMLKDKKILGLKGVSGYQLITLPKEDTAKRLRLLKGRENKPFAVMFASLDVIRDYAFLSDHEEKLLASSARPIVLLRKRRDFSAEVDRDSRYIGAFLPSAGIHRILCDEIGPIIVTSANSSGSPIITDDFEFADSFFNQCDINNKERHVDGILYHDREIVMPQDDSVMFSISTKYGDFSQFIRRSRGFAPLPVIVPDHSAFLLDTPTVLAFGGDLKSSFSFAKNDRIMPSQYIGDLEDYSVNELYKRLLDDYMKLFGQSPTLFIKDLHPGYFSSGLADELSDKENIRCIGLQHHFAHIYSVMAENGLTDCIGVSFDGTGFGTDGNIWGGEFILVNGAAAERAGHLSYIKLIGGDMAVKDAASTKYCYLHSANETGASNDYIQEHNPLLDAGLKNNINTFLSSSMGRLFDAVSALLDICPLNTYEGECAIMLEKRAWEYLDTHPTGDFIEDYVFEIKEDKKEIEADQIKLFSRIAQDAASGLDKGLIAYSFHMAIARMIVSVCDRLRAKTSGNKICLSGGVFNNRILLKESIELLGDSCFDVYWNRQLPSGDGGISAGQAYYGLLCSKDVL